MHRLRAILLLAPLLAALPGCAGDPLKPTLEVAAGEYAQAFQAVKDTMRHYEFELDRIDAREGVITTLPRQSAGWATPWIQHASTSAQATDDLLQHVRRVARVTFEPVESGTEPAGTPRERGAPAGTAGAPVLAPDLRERTGPLRARFEVTIQRVYRPLHRVPPASIRLASYAVDPELVRRGLQPQHEVEVRPDPELASRMAQDAAHLLAQSSGRPADTVPDPIEQSPSGG